MVQQLAIIHFVSVLFLHSLAYVFRSIEIVQNKNYDYQKKFSFGRILSVFKFYNFVPFEKVDIIRGETEKLFNRIK